MMTIINLNRKQKNYNQGITLITLVITIIVLLILAGICVAMLTGKNGILAQTNEAKEETKKAEYQEELDTIQLALELKKNREHLTTEEVMKLCEEKIRASKKFQQEGTQILWKDKETIRVITPEGYVYDVTMEGVEYQGKQGEKEIPDLQEGDIQYKITPSNWTNKSVEVEIATKEGYLLEYSYDGKSWTKYNEKIVEKENKEIIARGKTDLDEIKGYATLNIENIDKLAPDEFVPTATSTTNTITLIGNTTDAEKTKTDGNSGIEKYYFSKDNGVTWEPKDGQIETNYTFTGLTQNQNYNLKMKAVDKAKNETITEPMIQGTGKVPGGLASISFNYSPSDWTNGDVTVSITTMETGYNLEYSKDGNTWEPYTTEITMTNNGEVYARLKDNSGQIGAIATGNVTKIDRTLPTAGVQAGAISNKTVTITATGSDSQSGVSTYQFYVGGKLKSTQNSTAGSATYQYTTTFGSVNAYVIVTDKVGNAKQSNTITITDNTIKTLAELKTFRDRVNAGTTYQGVTVTQIENINIGGSSAGNWTPIGTNAHRFNGTYDGGNCTISGLYISHTTGDVGDRGLFGNTNTSSYIKNLTISNASVTTISINSAIVVGVNRGSIENVKVVGGTATIGAAGAGIAGYHESGKIISCSNSATISYTSTVPSNYSGERGFGIGGIVGNQTGGTVEKCMNTGTITGAHGSGGISGSISNGTIQLCVNKGTVNGKIVTDYGIIGGIVGFASWEGTSNILNCYNTGKIASETQAGGITGDCIGNGGTTTIRNCYNIGTVSANNSKGGITSQRNPTGTFNCSNNYWLSTCGVSYGIGWDCNANASSNTGAVSKTAAQLKALTSTLGSAYKADTKNINGGYPILTWQ